eukprot:230100-Hanusia_phi.AAC.1
MEALEKLKYDPLDVKAPGWHDDYSRLKLQETEETGWEERRREMEREEEGRGKEREKYSKVETDSRKAEGREG